MKLPESEREANSESVDATTRLRIKERVQTLGLLIGAALILSLMLWILFHLSQYFWPEAWLQKWHSFQAQPLKQSFIQVKLHLADQPLLPLFFIGLQIIQVLFAPIPGQAAGLFGGWLFGFWGGLALTMLGLTLGSGLAMLLGRWGGRPLLQLFVPPDLMGRFDVMIEHSGPFSFFMLFLLPALPDDAICLIAGMTRLRLSQLLLMAVLGRLPGMAVLSWLGRELMAPDWKTQWILVFVGLLSLWAWLFQERIEARFLNWVKPKVHD